MTDLIIYGTGKLGQMVYFLLKNEAKYNIVCFTADEKYCTEKTFLSLPLIPFDSIEENYPKEQYKMITVVGGFGGTRIRKEMFDKAKAKGYFHVNYIHPSVVNEGDIEMGENNIIFPYCILGFSGKMADNNIIREKVYLGHDFEMGSHNFIGVGCNIGGESKVGDLTYLAMNTTLTNNICIGDESFVGIGSLVLKNTDSYSKYYGRPAKKVEENREEGIIINGNR